MQSETIGYNVVVRSSSQPSRVYSSFVFTNKTIAEEYASMNRSNKDIETFVIELKNKVPFT